MLKEYYRIDVLGHSGPIRAIFLPEGMPSPNYPNMTMDSNKSNVEFYDRRYAGPRFTPDGQFITRYYVSTLLEPLKTQETIRGLNLNGGIPDWSIGPRPYSLILIWLEYLHTL